MGQSTENQTFQSTRKSPSRVRQRADRLPEVLVTAAALFSNKGYVATTLEDIAAKLGMTRPALYYYAKSKEDLLTQCYIWTYQKFMAEVEGAITSGTGRERLERFFMLYAETVCDDVGRSFQTLDTDYLGPDAQKLIKERSHAINVLVAGLLYRGEADGSLASCDHHFALATLFGAFNALHATDRRGLTPREVAKKMLTLLLRGLEPRS